MRIVLSKGGYSTSSKIPTLLFKKVNELRLKDGLQPIISTSHYLDNRNKSDKYLIEALLTFEKSKNDTYEFLETTTYDPTCSCINYIYMIEEIPDEFTFEIITDLLGKEFIINKRLKLLDELENINYDTCKGTLKKCLPVLPDEIINQLTFDDCHKILHRIKYLTS